MYTPAVELNFEIEARRTSMPHSVLGFALLSDRLVLVKHPSRGWEVPGGKVEPGETPIAALERELYEEAGLDVCNVTWLLEYQIRTHGRSAWKWGYVADVKDVRARPRESEIIDVKAMRLSSLKPEVVNRDPNVSPIMRDAVYEECYRHLLLRMLDWRKY